VTQDLPESPDHKTERGNRTYQTSPAVRNPNPQFLRPIIDSSNACNQASAPILCMPLHGPVQFAMYQGVRLVGRVFSPKLPLSLRGSSPHVTHCPWGQAHSSSQTASRSVLPFLYGFQVLCCTMHCQWGRKPQKLSLRFKLSSRWQRRTEARQ